MVEKQASQRLRLRVIPATFCWVVGAIFLLGIPFIAYYTWNRFPIEFPESRAYVLLCYLSIAKAPCALIAGLLIILAGNQFMRGKWLFATLQFAIACMTIGIYQSIREIIRSIYY